MKKSTKKPKKTSQKNNTSLWIAIAVIVGLAFLLGRSSSTKPSTYSSNSYRESDYRDMDTNKPNYEYDNQQEVNDNLTYRKVDQKGSNPKRYSVQQAMEIKTDQPSDLVVKITDASNNLLGKKQFVDLSLGFTSGFEVSPSGEYIAFSVDNVGTGCNTPESCEALDNAQKQVQEKGGVWLFNVDTQSFRQVGNNWGDATANQYHKFTWIDDDTIEYSLDAEGAVPGTYTYTVSTQTNKKVE